MSLNLKKIVGAGLLTVAVIGGTTTFLNATLASAANPKIAQETVTAEQKAPQGHRAEVTVTEGWAS